MFQFSWNSYGIYRNEVVIQHSYLSSDFQLHKHDFTELVIVLSGYGSHIIDNKCYPISMGDVYIINEGSIHGFKVPRDLEIINILFNPNEILLEEIRRDLNGYRAMFEIEPLYRIERDFNARLTIDLFHINELKGLAEEMLSLSGTRNNENRILTKTLLNLIIIKLSCLYDHKEEQKPRQLVRLSGALDYIENHFSEELDTEMLANKINFSPRHFTRLFKSIFNMTPKQYIMKTRLTHACKLLSKNDHTISELASLCGYPDTSYFSRLFLERYKLTPKEYRKSRMIKSS